MPALTLMRHAKSAYPDGVADFDRPLSDRGRRNVREMTDRLLALDPLPSYILSSAALRTTETTRAINQSLNLPETAIDLSDSLYLASSDDIQRQLDDTLAGGIEHLLVIGHNPGFENLCRQLDSNAPRAMKTAAFCHFLSNERGASSPWRLVCHETPTRD